MNKLPCCHDRLSKMATANQMNNLPCLSSSYWLEDFLGPWEMVTIPSVLVTHDQGLALIQDFFQRRSKMYYYANFFCYANFYIAFGPNFRGGQNTLRRGRLLQGGAPLWRKARRLIFLVTTVTTEPRKASNSYFDEESSCVITN